MTKALWLPGIQVAHSRHQLGHCSTPMKHHVGGIHMKKYLFVMIAALSLSAAAFAGSDGGQPVSARTISLDDFKFRCAHPEQTDIQRAPQNIRIQCTDDRHEYVATAPGSLDLPGARTVTAAVFSDKFNVDSQSKAVPGAGDKAGSCMRFKEVEQTLTIEKPLSCDDILSIKGDLSDYCQDATDLAKGVNPKLIDSHDTGNAVDTCPGSAAAAGKGGKS